MVEYQNAQGFRSGQHIKMLVETTGEDHLGVEHKLPAGSVGVIDAITMMRQPQGVAFTVWIPVDGEDVGIVNVFDESDGPISNFIAAKE